MRPRTFVVSATLTALLTVTLAACSGKDSAPDAAIPSGVALGDFAGLVDIGGRHLYLECRGTGSPTVIAESGLLNAGDTWAMAEASHGPAVDPGIVPLTRLCTYDRPGTALNTAPPTLGRSDAAPMPRTAADVVADLHALLTAARVPTPYVLVGHSLGGTFVRLYASTYPDQVAGMVLEDASLLDLLQARLTPRQWDGLRQLLRTPSIPLFDDTGNLERYDVDVSVTQLRAAPPLPNIPMVVLSASQQDPLPYPRPTGAVLDFDTAYAAHRNHQDDVAALVPGARHIIAPTGHYVHSERPDLVIEAVRHVVDLTHALSPR